MANTRILHSLGIAARDLTTALAGFEDVMARKPVASESYTIERESQQRASPRTMVREATQVAFESKLTPFDRRLLRAAGVSPEVTR